MRCFGILGGQRVSRLGRAVVEQLQSAGWPLVLWVEGAEEVPPPGEDLLPHAPPCPVLPPEQAARWLLDHPVDFLLQLSPGAPPAALDPCKKIWRFASPSPGPLPFWDVYDGLYHLEIRLEQYTLQAGWTIPLERRIIRVDRLSYRNTVEAVRAELAEMVVHVARCGAPRPEPAPICAPPQIDAWPSAWTQTMLRWRLRARLLADQIHGILYAESWTVGVVEQPVTEFLDMGFRPEVRWLPPPSPQRFLADPFVVRTPQGWLLLAEDFDFTTNLGRIVHEFSPDGNFTGTVEDAITEPCHMSYPFPLELDGALYCIPETHQKNGAFAWRWDPAARTWTQPREILTGFALTDPTIVFFEDRWWLFGTDKQNGVDAKLHVYFAAAVWGPWTPHPRNPVKVDVRSSRPGGMPFLHEGKLYRPAQDSSKHYGWRLVINQVTCLTPEEFSEDTVRVVDGEAWGMRGVHTLSGAGPRVVLDAAEARFMAGRTLRLIKHKFRRMLGREDN
jgi:hypothetical protein